MICYIVPWWPSWLSDQIAFSNSASDVVWRVSRLPPWPSSWILELNDSAILNLYFTPMPPMKFRLNLTYCLGGDVIWRISRWRPSWTLEQKDYRISISPKCLPSCLSSNRHPSVADVISRFSRQLPWWPSWISERNHFSNSKSPCCPDAFHQVSPPTQLTVREHLHWTLTRQPEEMLFEDFQEGWQF